MAEPPAVPSDRPAERPSDVPWRRRLYVVIFRHDTPAGRLFDTLLLVAIFASVVVVLLESVEPIRARWGPLLVAVEWVFTVLFTVEYALRILAVRNARHYALSPLGLIDLLSILPTYLGLFFGGAQAFIVIRALRLLRVFRVLKMANYSTEAGRLIAAMRASRRKIIVFVVTVLTIVLIVGSAMYLIEGPANGFTSIPTSMYWAIVTLTTVGYGDIAPRTPVGQMLASAVMILGYGIIAVPTGIVTAELIAAERGVAAAAAAAAAEAAVEAIQTGGVKCPACRGVGHDVDARFCKHCGAALFPGETAAPTSVLGD